MMGMETEFPLKSEADILIEERGYQRPLTVGEAKNVTDKLAEAVEGLQLDRGRRRRLMAQIHRYLTAGGGNNTHASARGDGEIKPISRGRARSKFDKSKMKRV